MGEIDTLESGLSVRDIKDENRDFVREKVSEVVAETFKPLDSTIEIVEIYIFGSFKNGTATRMASDLDLRVVLRGDINGAEGGLIKETVKNEVTSQLPSDRVFGYVDPKIFPEGHETNTKGIVL